jgi:hypothetical protein
MNQQLLLALAAQRAAELRESAPARRSNHARRRPGQSLRVRTGWTLVGLGLRLVSQPGSGMTRRPRPVSS